MAQFSMIEAMELIQQGFDIDGEASGDQSGSSVLLVILARVLMLNVFKLRSLLSGSIDDRGVESRMRVTSRSRFSFLSSRFGLTK